MLRFVEYSRALALLCALVASGARGQTSTSLDARVQAPTLQAPERGSLVGQLSAEAFGPGELVRGTFQLPSALTLPSERGGPLSSVLPSYAADNGLGEWGLGWQSSLALVRWRERGELDYATDELTGPFGRLVRGTDGAWYPLGLSKPVRLVEVTDTWVAYLPDGSRWTFGGSARVTTQRGTYAWYLTQVESATGRRMLLEYEANASGRLFLKTVHYGGTGTGFQYRIDLAYEPLARQTVDLRSGTALVLDRRVTAVAVLARSTATGLFELRWRDALTYEPAALGPGFFLVQVQRTYASGEQAPPVRYTYGRAEEHLTRVQLTRNTKLDALLAARGIDAIQADKASLLDVNLDGRLDLEHHLDNTLYVQGDAGFAAEPLPAATSTASPLCRRSPSILNAPRMLVQMRATEDAFHVVGLQPNNARTQTALVVCNRTGEPLGTQTLTGDWALESNTRLVDVNRDLLPDLVKVSAGRVTILPNTSSGTSFSFGAAVTTTLSPIFTPNTSWVHDINGDGLADLISRGSSGSLSVWLGKGGFGFETTARNFAFYTTQNIPFSSLSDYHLSFIDANRDGLADVVLSRISTPGAYLYVNTGSSFIQQSVPALTALSGTVSRPVVGDFLGSGNAEVAYVVSGQAWSLALETPATALLRTADDGKGTVLTFEYARSPPSRGGRARQVVLSALEVRSSGSDTVRYSYAYGEPTVHSVAKFLVGFGTVTRSGPGLFHEMRLLNSDTYAGLPSSSIRHDLRSMGLHTYEYRRYADALFQGVPWKRLTEEGSGFAQEDGQSIGERVKYLLYEAELCPARTVRHTAFGTLTTEVTRAALASFSGHLHCLSAAVRVTGTHPDSSLDFRNEVRLTRNAAGLVEKVEDVSSTGSVLTLQQVAYRSDALIESMTVPGRGTTRFEWQPGTLQLQRVISPEGVVLEAPARHPLTSAIFTLNTWRGTRVHSQFFRYDGQERLLKQWDNLGGATEARPNLLLAYRYATATHPGSITTTSLVDAATGAFMTGVEWQNAAGEGVARATRIPDGWMVDGLTSRSRNLLETRRYVRPALPADMDPAALDYATLLAGADVVGVLSTSGLGLEATATSRLHTDVQREVDSRLAVEGNWLLQEAVENGTHTTRRYLDANQHTVAFDDEAGSRYSYEYDALGRLRTVILPDSKRHRVSFDGHGRVSRVDREGVASVIYTYDPTTGFLVGKAFLTPVGTAVRLTSFQYDSFGRKRQDVYRDVASGATRTYTFFYDGATPTTPARNDSAGLLTAISGQGYVKLLEYRVDGKPIHTTLQFTGWRTVEAVLAYREDGSARSEEVLVRGPDGALLSRTQLANTRDAYGRTKVLSLNSMLLADLDYDAKGLLVSATLDGSSRAAFTHDPLTRALSGFSLATPVFTSSNSWKFNARALLESESLQIGALSLTRTHGHSAQRFLTSSRDTQDTYGYEYDASGLPTRIEENGSSRTQTRSGSTLIAGSVTYTFDGLGRTVRRGDLSLTYGPDGQVSRATRGTTSWDFLYDEAGQRLLKLKARVPLGAYLAGGGYLDGNGLTLPLKVGGRLVGIVRNNVFTPLAADMRGTVLSDADGTARLVSPYGDRIKRSASAAALDYVEKGYDADLGLVRMGGRDYDPSIARFTTPDPLFLEQPEECGRSPVECNLYGYARSNPLQFVDPTGMSSDGLSEEEYAETRYISRNYQALPMTGKFAEAQPIVEAVVEEHPFFSLHMIFTGQHTFGGEASWGDRVLAGISRIPSGAWVRVVNGIGEGRRFIKGCLGMGDEAVDVERAATATERVTIRLGKATTTDYRSTFFSANPHLQGKVWVHHSIEKRVLQPDNPYYGLFTSEEIHSLENLRGIPNEINSDLHLSKIRLEWDEFYRNNAPGTPNLREKFLEKAAEIDRKFGSQFTPSVGSGP